MCHQMLVTEVDSIHKTTNCHFPHAKRNIFNEILSSEICGNNLSFCAGSFQTLQIQSVLATYRCLDSWFDQFLRHFQYPRCSHVKMCIRRRSLVFRSLAVIQDMFNRSQLHSNDSIKSMLSFSIR